MFSRLFEYYCFVMVTVALALSIAIKELLSVIAAPGFHGAYKIVPVIALAYIFQGTNRFVLAGSYIAKKTMNLGAVGLASAGINIVLNLLLIPRYGMLGAAWSTAFSFFLMSVMAWFVSQSVYRIPYMFSRVIMMLGLATLTYFASSLVALPSFALQVSLKVALFAAFPVALYVLGFFRKAEVEKGKTFAQAILNRYRLRVATEPGR
jgi:O-antigen/teichoic acid export membrane protein